jgi:hypothetical protein
MPGSSGFTGALGVFDLFQVVARQAFGVVVPAQNLDLWVML